MTSHCPDDRTSYSCCAVRTSSLCSTVQSYRRVKGSRKDSPRCVREYSTPRGEVSTGALEHGVQTPAGERDLGIGHAKRRSRPVERGRRHVSSAPTRPSPPAFVPVSPRPTVLADAPASLGAGVPRDASDVAPGTREPAPGLPQDTRGTRPAGPQDRRLHHLEDLDDSRRRPGSPPRRADMARVPDIPGRGHHRLRLLQTRVLGGLINEYPERDHTHRPNRPRCGPPAPLVRLATPSPGPGGGPLPRPGVPDRYHDPEPGRTCSSSQGQFDGTPVNSTEYRLLMLFLPLTTWTASSGTHTSQ